MVRKNHSRTNIISSLNLFLLSCLYFVCVQTKVEAQNGTVPVNVNVGLVVNDLESLVGKVDMSCINMALSDFYSTHASYKTRLLLNTRQVNDDDVVGAAAAGSSSISLFLYVNERQQVPRFDSPRPDKKCASTSHPGPPTSMQADFVIDLGEKAHVPIITYSATSPALTSIRSSYFFRATQNGSTQVNGISALVQAFGWREAVPIYVDDEYGQGVIPYLTDALQAVNARVPYRSAISLMATDGKILEELYKLMTMQTRVFIVHMLPSLGSRLFALAKQAGMMSKGYVWIMTDGMTDFFGTLDPSVVDSMQGVLGVRPYVPMSKDLKSFQVRWKRKFWQDNPEIIDAQLNIFGLWAYDAITALAMAIEQAGNTNLGYQKTNASSNSSTDLDSFGVSLNGPNLLQALSNTSFRGLTGEFSFVDGQLPAATYQIVNVNGDSARGIGFWTPIQGLAKQLGNPTNFGAYNTSSSSLAAIIWPGDSNTVPKGWEIPTSGRKLRIGVPVKDGFSEFVKITRDPSSNTVNVSGYCMAVFDAVALALPYALPYEYIPFATASGSSAGTYNDLVYQVFLGNYDAVVGDVTIIANRSLYADFTLPYTESGVSMVVPTTSAKANNAWVFLKPLTCDLWVTSFCFFVFIGFVVWVLEHRINEDFRGPPSHQVGTSLWFSFSTMVFAQRERVVSNLARMVVIVWCFVVLILTQSYTASLTSLLTVQQLQPTVKDVNQLIKSREYVGYQKGSFVVGILKRLGFDESKLVVYSSPEECDELFTKGSGNGGIAAAFDELPYLKLFLARYCSKYTMVEPTFRTDGFGFVFSRGSPLVSDISRAILNVTEGDKMNQIEDAWLGKQNNCQESSTTVTSNSLDLNSFWGLFLIAGVASSLALAVSVAMFLYEHKDELKPSEQKTSVWSRILRLSRIYNEKNLKSFTFKHIESKHGTVVSLPITGAPSPSVYSVHTDIAGEGGTPSQDYGDRSPTGQLPVEATGGEVPQEAMRLSIELVNSNKERPTTTEIMQDSY